MQRAISTYIYVKERLHPGLLDGLVRGGAQAIEIFAARQHLDYANRKQHVREIADWFRSSGIPLNSVHAPLYADYEWGRTGAPPVNVASTDRAARIEAMDEIKRALEIAEQIPFRFLVQHMGVERRVFRRPQVRSCHDFDRTPARLRQAAGGAHPAGEHSQRTVARRRDWWNSFAAAHFDDVGVCFDFGPCPLDERRAAGVRDRQDHIRSTHVHDNARDRDSHLWPGQGSIDWKAGHGVVAVRSAHAAVAAGN